MFKHLTRNLKLGLTTLTILTAGAGTAFAQPAGFNGVIDPIAVCSNGGGFRNPSYCTTAVVNCINNPFGTSCATTLGTKAHTVAKVRYCGDASHHEEPACATTVAGVNAAMWAKQHPDALTTPSDGNKFLKGTAAGLDTSGITILGNHLGALYFDTATFDGKALEGDATDGVAFVTSGSPYNHYAGILSGTDLGAPLTQRSGTASWVGQFQALYNGTNRDFVLEITFGGDGDKAGSIEAFVQRFGIFYYHLKGYFDNSGLIIEGTVDYGRFTDNDRDNPTSTRGPGTLTGLIGQEGAVGAFHRNDTSPYWYAGGFVARPVNLVTDLSPTFIADTCTGSDGDPFHEFCHIGDVGKVAMDEERKLRVVECIHGGNASNNELCENAVKRNPCIRNPFDTACVTDDKFATHHVAARANRITFCNDASNAQNALCTGNNLAIVCGYDPFASICFGSDAASVTRLPEKRTAKNKECGAHSSANDPSCTSVLGRASSASFLQSFATELNTVAARVNLTNQFLKNLDTAADAARTFGTRTSRPFVSITLASVRKGGLDLDGEAADGVASFGSTYNNRYGYHAGILSTTDLGKPLTAESAPTGEWKGIFETTGPSRFKTKQDFTLTVTFTAGQDHVGEVDAFVINNSGSDYYHLTGNFDDNGIIKGDVDFGRFRNGNSGEKGTGTRYPGRLQGLIGEQGAVGVFIFGTTNSARGNYAGGFVARPAATTFSDWVNSFDDALPTSPSTGSSAKNQFLKGGKTGLSNIGVTGVIRNSLNLADATFGGNRLGGDSVDGVAFFRGTHSGGAKHYYAGILSGTDLGGLITQTTGSANWKGSIQPITGLTSNNQLSAVDFTLTVNFGGTGDRAGRISGNFGLIPGWTLSGHFDTNGIITGNIYSISQTVGNVTGLIGQQGAVGAFYATGSTTYSGGFVACPYDSVNNRCER